MPLQLLFGFDLNENARGTRVVRQTSGRGKDINLKLPRSAEWPDPWRRAPREQIGFWVGRTRHRLARRRGRTVAQRSATRTRVAWMLSHACERDFASGFLMRGLECAAHGPYKDGEDCQQAEHGKQAPACAKGINLCQRNGLHTVRYQDSRRPERRIDPRQTSLRCAHVPLGRKSDTPWPFAAADDHVTSREPRSR